MKAALCGVGPTKLFEATLGAIWGKQTVIYMCSIFVTLKHQELIVVELLHLTLSMHVCMHERVCVDMLHVYFSKHHCTLCCKAQLFGVVSDQQPEMASTAASAAEPFLDASLLQCAETLCKLDRKNDKISINTKSI